MSFVAPVTCLAPVIAPGILPDPIGTPLPDNTTGIGVVSPRRLDCADEPDDADDDLANDDDLSVAQPLADEESNFDDFDDEFDDDFEEEENDPDWDHPDEDDEPPPPAKGPTRKK